jgi:hypothetical protein
MYFLNFLRFWDGVLSKPLTCFDFNPVVKFLSLSQIIFSDGGAQIGQSSGSEVQKKSTFSMENMKSHHPMSIQLCPLRMALRIRIFPGTQ